MVHPLGEDPFGRRSLREDIEAATGAFQWAPCEATTKKGLPCGNAALKYSERPVCHAHATDKEVELDRMKRGTARAREQNESLFGDL